MGGGGRAGLTGPGGVRGDLFGLGAKSLDGAAGVIGAVHGPSAGSRPRRAPAGMRSARSQSAGRDYSFKVRSSSASKGEVQQNGHEGNTEMVQAGTGQEYPGRRPADVQRARRRDRKKRTNYVARLDLDAVGGRERSLRSCSYCTSVQWWPSPGQAREAAVTVWQRERMAAGLPRCS
jgi:hypothetical protein